jgi:thiol-disulfide isomerase/thioredoxin
MGAKKGLWMVVAVFLLALAFCAVVGRAEAAEYFPKFSSQTLDGKNVTNAVFSGKKLTMVNIWATWCPPCVGEMPDLGRLGASMPKGTQLIGLLLDADDSGAIQKAKTILSKAKADFLQIRPSKEMSSYLNTVEAIPTTVFVDSEGRIVGEPLVGAHSEKAYRAEIEKALKQLR